MEILLLGPVEVRDGDRVHRPAGKQAAVLAALAREPGQTFTRERLIDELWPGDPPETAAKSIDVYLWRLRKAIPGSSSRSTARATASPPPEMPSICTGSRISSSAAGRPSRRAIRPPLPSCSRRRSTLWRGPALAGIDGIGGAQLDELRLAAHEDRIAAELETGNDARLAAELESLVPPTRCASGCARSSCSRSTGRAGRPTRSMRTGRPGRSSSRSSASSRRPHCSDWSRRSCARTLTSSCPTPSRPSRLRPRHARLPAETCRSSRRRSSGARASSSSWRRCSHPTRGW